MHKAPVNEDATKNHLNQKFNKKQHMEVLVSDLTYVIVNGKWNYLCVIIDLFNREIVGHAAGRLKSAELVKQALYSVKGSLANVKFFHSDRGSEFKNQGIDSILANFGIKRSLSKPGCPYDNAVSEAAYKVIKTEFVRKRSFDSLEQLKLHFDDYVNWYNNFRIHGSLDYMTPVEYRVKNCPI